MLCIRESRQLFVRLVLLSAILSLSSCGGSSGPVGTKDTVPVSVAQVHLKDVPVEIRSIGIVEAQQSATIVPQVGGILSSAHVTEGSYVSAGDLLFTIDSRPFAAQVKQQEANLARARAESQVAQTTFDRYSKLVGKGYVTKEQLDQSAASAAALAAAAKSAEATLENARLDLAYTEIRSPINGKTGAILIKPGNVVRANDTSSALMTIQQTKPVFVRFTISEQHLAEIRAEASAGQLSVNVIAKGSTSPITGQLSFIDNSVDRATGTILLKATFDNSDESLWAGQYVEAYLKLRTAKSSLVVPSEAIQNGQEGTFVWVVKTDGSVEYRKVSVLLSNATESAVQSGLSEGEVVVTDGQLRINPTSKVQIKGGLTETYSGVQQK